MYHYLLAFSQSMLLNVMGKAEFDIFAHTQQYESQNKRSIIYKDDELKISPQTLNELQFLDFFTVCFQKFTPQTIQSDIKKYIEELRNTESEPISLLLLNLDEKHKDYIRNNLLLRRFARNFLEWIMSLIHKEGHLNINKRLVQRIIENADFYPMGGKFMECALMSEEGCKKLFNGRFLKNLSRSPVDILRRIGTDCYRVALDKGLIHGSAFDDSEDEMETSPSSHQKLDDIIMSSAWKAEELREASMIVDLEADVPVARSKRTKPKPKRKLPDKRGKKPTSREMIDTDDSSDEDEPKVKKSKVVPESKLFTPDAKKKSNASRKILQKKVK